MSVIAAIIGFVCAIRFLLLAWSNHVNGYAPGWVAFEMAFFALGTVGAALALVA